jgi:hypothetical protein
MKTGRLVLFCVSSGVLQAQQESLQYFRPNNKSGLNIFETSKSDTAVGF